MRRELLTVLAWRCKRSSSTTHTFIVALEPEASGKSVVHSYGRVASMTAHVLKPLRYLGITGSSGPRQRDG